MTHEIPVPLGEPNWPMELGDAGGAALIIGARGGVGRVALTGAVVPAEEFWREFEEVAARPILDLAEEGGISPQGLGLVGEVIATAVAVRIAHRESSLTRAQVRDFLSWITDFLNTFIRGCDPV
jgi:hypothetical protein